MAVFFTVACSGSTGSNSGTGNIDNGTGPAPTTNVTNDGNAFAFSAAANAKTTYETRFRLSEQFANGWGSVTTTPSNVPTVGSFNYDGLLGIEVPGPVSVVASNGQRAYDNTAYGEMRLNVNFGTNSIEGVADNFQYTSDVGVVPGALVFERASLFDNGNRANGEMRVSGTIGRFTDNGSQFFPAGASRVLTVDGTASYHFKDGNGGKIRGNIDATFTGADGTNIFIDGVGNDPLNQNTAFYLERQP
ncbi:MAG: hypothetical protein AAFU41_13960 [Pseudomonadota bacterium]